MNRRRRTRRLLRKNRRNLRRPHGKSRQYPAARLGMSRLPWKPKGKKPRLGAGKGCAFIGLPAFFLRTGIYPARGIRPLRRQRRISAGRRRITRRPSSPCMARINMQAGIPSKDKRRLIITAGRLIRRLTPITIRRPMAIPRGPAIIRGSRVIRGTGLSRRFQPRSLWFRLSPGNPAAGESTPEPPEKKKMNKKTKVFLWVIGVVLVLLGAAMVLYSVGLASGWFGQGAGEPPQTSSSAPAPQDDQKLLEIEEIPRTA